MAELTSKQKLFCDEYLKDRNGKQAAIRAGYSERSAETTASRMLRNGKVSEYVRKHSTQRQERTQVTTDNVLKELAKGAFAELDVSTMKYSDKLKALELLCKNLGILDGSGSSRKDKKSIQERLLTAITGVKSE